MKRIVLTGGGTAGHVTPNLAILPSLKEAGYEVTYMGSYDGIEKRLVEDFDLPYVGISTGDFSETTLKHWHDLGFDMISAGADFDFLREGFRRNREVLQSLHVDV